MAIAICFTVSLRKGVSLAMSQRRYIMRSSRSLSLGFVFTTMLSAT